MVWGQAATARRNIDPEAYNQFLLGRTLAREQSVQAWAKSEQAYRKALAIDPGYAAAQAALADVLYEVSYFHDSAAEVIAHQEAALEMVEAAIRLDPGLANAWRIRARIRAETHWDVAGAIADIRHALELNPNDSDVLAGAARLFTCSRRFEEARAVVTKAVALDPLSTGVLLSASELQAATGDYAGTGAYARRILAIAPDSNYAITGVVSSELLSGNPQAALAALRGSSDGAREMYLQALVQHSLGNRAAADRALDDFIARHAAGWAYQIGIVYSWRGETDKAFEWLERAWRQHDGGLLSIQTEPMLAPLRKDARFAALRRKVGFTD